MARRPVLRSPRIAPFSAWHPGVRPRQRHHLARPTQVSDNESIWADECIYEPLYKATQNGKELVPDMATSYSLSANKLSWTFNLRHGVKFSNGQ